MKIVADTHTHSVASTHAYSTIQEIVKEAAENNLYAIAITDHAKSMPGAPGAWYFDNLSAIPNIYMGVRVLKGIEANIIDYEGNIDVEPYLQKSLDWIIASVHSVTLKGEPSIKKCTQMYLNAIYNPNITVFGHTGTPEYAYDYDKVISTISKSNKLIEINDSAFRYNKSSISNCVEIAKSCKKYNARIIVNTDSHFSTAVGKAEKTLAILHEMKFPEELIVNSSVDRFNSFLIERKISLT